MTGQPAVPEATGALDPDRPVGVLGAYGAVGRIAVARLAAAGIGPLRLGGRDLRRARAQADGLAAANPVAVDLCDAAALAAFCAGCRVVVNCAGPSYQVLGTVARAALAAGADYIDAAGDRIAVADLDGTPDAASRRVLVFSAGVMPGLTGLLPRLLLDRDDPPARLEMYAGGAAPLSRTSALDVLLTRGPDFGSPFAAWRDGCVVERALEPRRGLRLRGFDGPVDAVPFLSTEAAALGASFGLSELDAYTVYVSEHLPTALTLAWADATAGPDEHADAVVDAAAADVMDREPYHTLLVRAPTATGTRHEVRLNTTDPAGLSGVVVALTVASVLTRTVPAGVHFAADVLHPRAVAGALVSDPLVTDLEIF